MSEDRAARRSRLRGPDGLGGPHVFVANLEALELDDHDRHHLAAALRLRPGAAMTVSDGDGRWRACRFGDRIEPAGEIVEVAAPTPIGVGFVPVKTTKPEFVVQKLTELGVDEIVICFSQRSVVRWDEAKWHKLEPRLDRVAREASMQSRRVRVPVVSYAGSISDFAGHSGVAIADPSGVDLAVEHRFVLVGPEGGWDDAELAGGWPVVALGSQILRAETAAIAAGVLLASIRDRP